MKSLKYLSLAASIIALLIPTMVFAGGFKGKVAGAARGSGRSLPAGGRSSVPNLGAARSAAAGRNLPSANRPSLPSKLPSRPTNLPSKPSNLPSINRPNVSLPNGGATGGFKPSTRPSLPQSLPAKPNVGDGGLGNIRSKLPENRPSIPDLGGGNRPDVKLPKPDGGFNRPSIGNGGIKDKLSENRPNIPNLGGSNRPDIKLPGDGGNRPSRGELGDFLNLKDSIQAPKGDLADRAKNLKSSKPGERINNKIVSKPRTNIQFGDINVGKSTVINNRPTWVNIDNKKKVDINNRWKNQIGGVRGWPARNPARIAQINGWGNSVRVRYGSQVAVQNCFRGNWWLGHRHPLCGWHYGYAFGRYPAAYWWTYPTYAACVRWFTWTAPAGVWQEPLYYDYGTGGNVVYNENIVYVDGEAVATANDFAASAMDLATVPPPADESEAASAEWMPLGVFAVSADEQDVEPTRVAQLAVNKDGVVSGTLFNLVTDSTNTIQGQVDKETQRVAFRLGSNETIVIETGLYNLTQDEAPVLVHFGTDKVENWLLVRIEDQQESTSDTQ